MIYEITGSRLLAPHLGTSTYIWTSLIGVILGSLSIGYWLGGRLADRKPEAKTLSLILLLAALLMAFTIFAKDFMLKVIASLSVYLEIKALIAAVVLFAPISVLLGIVPPFIVRLRITALENSGKIVGRLYALSTLGSIGGTFAAGFLLIPYLGSTRILYLIAGVLLILSFLLMSLTSWRKTKAAVLFILTLAIAFTELKIYGLRTITEFYDFDTEYNRIQISRGFDTRNGAAIRLLQTDPYSVQSAMYLEGDDLVLDFTKYYHLLRHYKPDFKNTLMIGGGGYSFPKEYLRVYPEAKIEVVEIDPGMTNLAQRFFRLTENSNLKITHEDGRVFLNQAQTGKADIILLDAFNSLSSIPFQLTTLEAIREMNRVLSDDGVVILNLVSALEGENSKFFAAEYNTFSKVFPQVHVYKIKAEMPDNVIQNIILVAAKSENTPGRADSVDPAIKEMLKNLYVIKNFPLESQVLTDDWAPVDYYRAFSESN